jgi:hypothetical protein
VTPPQTALDEQPNDPTNSSSATFTFAADEQASFACSLDGAAFTACSSPTSYDGLGEGRHSFEVRATDHVGNADPTPAAYAWTIDQTAPQTTITAGPPDPTNDTSASFDLSSDEAGSTFACSLDGAPFAVCGSPADYTALEPGTHSFRVRATDPAGNADPTPAGRSWTIDVTPPETTIDSGPADPTNITSAGFAFSAGEAASFECRLDGGIFAPCSSPHARAGLDEGSHAFDVRAIDAAGNIDATPARYSWTIDVTPPETSIDAGPADPTNSTTAAFSFSADESGSTFACSLDGASFAACSSPVEYAGLTPGAHELRVEATDRAGNADPNPASYFWLVDTTAPQTVIDSGPGTTASTSATIAFSASEPGSTFECSLDAAAFTPCASPREYSDLTVGVHQFRVRATDPAGNTDSTPAIHMWEIDRTPPETSITERPADPTNSSTASFSFSGSDDRTPGSQLTLECRLDSADAAAWLDCSSPQVYLGLAEGSHTFEVRAIDLAGNADESPASYRWTIDRTAPQTTIDSGPPGTTTSSSAAFTFSAGEAGSTFECSLDGSAFAACTSPREYAGLPVGGHEFSVRASDVAGNTDASPAIYGWTIEAPPDTTAPETTIDSGPPVVTSSTGASFTFSASKPNSTFECSLDGAPFAGCTSPRQYTGLASGSHQFRVRARDTAGNVDPTPAAHNWTIDTAAPQTTISSGPPAVTSSTSASFGFTSNEPGSVFECSLDGAAFASCTSPRQYAGLAAGAHQFRVRATDPAGNTDATPAAHSWTIDTAAPETTIDSAPPATTTSTSASFSFSASEPGASFECSLDDAAFAVCTSPRQYTGLAVGTHQFRVRARDAAGNTDASPATHSWTISAPNSACPAPITLAAAADAWIDENSPSTNKGDDSILKVQSKGPRDNFRALVRFGLPVLPQGCVVDTATLRLYAASMKPGRVLEALRLAAPWAENAVSWSNQPATTGAAATTASGFGYRDWDVTSQVRAMLGEGVNHGFLIRDIVEGADAEQQLHSREKGDNPPQLVVRFAASSG